MGKRTHYGDLVSLGLLAGALLGTRESLMTLGANAFVQPSQYFLVYLAVPILTWILLAFVILVAWTIARVALSRIARVRLSAASYAAAVAFAGMLSILVPWSADIGSRLSAVGFEYELYSSVVLMIVVLAMAIAIGLLARGMVTLYLDAVSRPLSYVAIVVLGVSALLLAPVARFFVTDWKWGIAPSEIASTSAVERPNVLLISIDTLRADHLGSYGGPRGLTPNMDRLAEGGVTFLQAISSSPWTLPAMASVLTGLHPRHHRAGLITNRRDPLGRSPLREDTWTLTAELRKQGYRTHAIVTNPYLALSYGLGEGFRTYQSVTIESEIFLSFRDTTAFRLLRWLWPGIVVGDRGETVSARAETWLEEFLGDEPFFLWLHYIDPHPPYSALGTDGDKTFRTDSLLGGDSRELPDLALRSPDVARLRSGEIRLSEEGKDLVRALYRAEVHAVDAAVGTVLDTLERRGLRADTLVVLVADHGEEFWEHGGVEHGHTVYDELLRVPLILRWPGHLRESKKVDALVRIVDIAPTILGLLDFSIPDGLDGRSVVPLLSGNESGSRIALGENMLFAEERVAIRTADHKYILWGDGREEVYDLRADPQERVNLVALPEVVEPLRTLSQVLGARVPDESGEVPPTLSVDARTQHALKALGYLH